MKEYIVSQEYIDGIYTDEGSTFGLDMQKELIRCQDCESHRNRSGICDVWHHHTSPQGFCHRGRRYGQQTESKEKSGRSEG